MNYIFVILGVIIIILIYVVYAISSNKTTIVSSASLAVTNPPITITNQPYSQQYTYNLLFYISSMPNFTGATATLPPQRYTTLPTVPLPPNDMAYLIFARGGDGKIGSGTLNLILVQTNKGYGLVWVVKTPNGRAERYIIMENIGLQQWMYISVATNNQFVDLYINGKLVKSIDTQFTPNMANTSNQIYLGNGINGTIQTFTYFPTTFTATDVYNSYMGLNSGFNYLYSLFTTYKVQMSLTKNGVTSAPTSAPTTST